MFKRYAILITVAGIVFGAGFLAGQGQNKFGTPSTILHIVTVQWKADSTADQQNAAIDGIKTMAGATPGIKNIWVKKLKVQPAKFNTAFVIEFENKAAFDRYTDAPAHKAWEKLYLPIREESSTHDVTN
jgi:hypothetical protein